MKKIILSLTILCFVFGFSNKLDDDITPKFESTTIEAFTNIRPQLTEEEYYYFKLLVKQTTPSSFLNRSHNYLFYTRSVDIRDTSFDDEFDYFDNKDGCADRIEQYNSLPLKAPKQETIAYKYPDDSKKEARTKARSKYANRYALLYFIDRSGDVIKITLKFETPNDKIKIGEYRKISLNRHPGNADF